MKCYIYCTKAKPYLWKYHCISDDYNGNSFETSYSKEDHDSTDDGEILNGQIVASFDLNNVKEISQNFAYQVANGKLDLQTHYDEKILKMSNLTNAELDSYSKFQDVFAWYIENLEILDKPLELSHFSLSKAPQSWCYANVEDEECILISIKPEWVCKILNREKTIEVRKNAPKELIK